MIHNNIIDIARMWISMLVQASYININACMHDFHLALSYVCIVTNIDNSIANIKVM